MDGRAPGILRHDQARTRCVAMLELGQNGGIPDAYRRGGRGGAAENTELPQPRLKLCKRIDPAASLRDGGRTSAAAATSASNARLLMPFNFFITNSNKPAPSGQPAARGSIPMPASLPLYRKKVNESTEVRRNFIQASKSLSEIGNTREQNSQSTLMKPSSSTISCRSSSGNRPITPRICSKLQRQPFAKAIVDRTLISSSSWNRRQSSSSSARP